jgi:hypothetical protein
LVGWLVGCEPEKRTTRSKQEEEEEKSFFSLRGKERTIERKEKSINFFDKTLAGLVDFRVPSDLDGLMVSSDE